MLTIAALFIGGIIVLFAGLSIAGLFATEDSERDAADTGIVRHRP